MWILCIEKIKLYNCIYLWIFMHVHSGFNRNYKINKYEYDPPKWILEDIRMLDICLCLDLKSDLSCRVFVSWTDLFVLVPLSSQSVTVFFLSDWRWVVMRRKRTEQSLQGPAVCLWRVTGPNTILQTSGMNLDPHTQSKRPATNMWTCQTESSENEPVNDVFWIKTCLCLQRTGPETESRVSRVQLCVSEEWLVQTSSSKLQ